MKRNPFRISRKRKARMAWFSAVFVVAALSGKITSPDPTTAVMVYACGLVLVCLLK